MTDELEIKQEQTERNRVRRQQRKQGKVKGISCPWQVKSTNIITEIYDQKNNLRALRKRYRKLKRMKDYLESMGVKINDDVDYSDFPQKIEHDIGPEPELETEP